jgi:hypothetical protein
VGATKKYSDGWETAFSRGKKTVAVHGAPKKKKTAVKKATAKGSPKKKADGKKGKKK